MNAEVPDVVSHCQGPTLFPLHCSRAPPSYHVIATQREQALREAEEERRARIQALEQASEMEEAKKRAEHEADQLRLQRAISVANRKEMLERMNREAETKAKRVEELTAMLEEAKFVAKDAEIRALKAESAVSLEEERAQEKKKAERSLVEAAVRGGRWGWFADRRKAEYTLASGDAAHPPFTLSLAGCHKPGVQLCDLAAASHGRGRDCL